MCSSISYHLCSLTRETKIFLVFPPSLLSSSEVLSDLSRFVEYRMPKHRKGFYLWMGIIPFTAPFKLIRTSTSCLYPSMSVVKADSLSNHTQSSLFLFRLALMVAL